MSVQLELPAGWAQATVAELASAPAVYGILQPGPDQPGGIPYVRPTEIRNDAIQVADLRRTSKRIADKYHRSSLAQHDVVLSIVGTIGKVALVPPELEGANITQSSARIRFPREIILPRFGAYALRSPLLVTQFNVARLGTAVPRLNLAHVRDLALPVAPFAEQHRIVSAIESYFTRLDDAVATLERVQRNLKRYRASVLKAAVEGRLVPTEAELARAEGRSYEPASVLLTRILAERRRRWEEAELAKMTAEGKAPKDDKWKAKYVEPAAPDTSELPELPEGWCWASLAQLFVTITDGDHQPPPQSSEGIPFLVIGDVRSGRVDVSNCRFVPRTYYDSLAEPRKPRYGDLLYTVTGSYGIPVRVVHDAPFCVQRHIAILRPTGYSNREFLYYALQSRAVVEQANEKATGTAQKTVGLESLRAFVVPLPPSSEQSRIVLSLEAHFSSTENIETAAKASARRLARLRQSILKWAFEGRLVDQDPTDEPASVLLERIRAERAGAVSVRRPRRFGPARTGTR